jgi:hypothetical protein
VSEEQINHLLEIVSKYSNKNWHQVEEYKHAWNARYEEIVTYYVEKLISLSTAFFKSPAGERFKSEVEKCRSQKQALPALDIDSLQEFDGEKGIEWGVNQVYEFFQILETIADILDFKSMVYQPSSNVLTRAA